MRKDFKNILGQAFGEWIVVQLVPNYPKRGAYWKCKCSCGNESIVSGAELRRGSSTQCKSCQSTKQNTKHGKSRSPVYVTWENMIQRCTNPNRKDFRHYGGRGITVCEEWLRDFEVFYNDVGDPPAGKTLDRIDNNGPYCRSNCRWATKSEQRRNQRR